MVVLLMVQLKFVSFIFDFYDYLYTPFLQWYSVIIFISTARFTLKWLRIDAVFVRAAVSTWANKKLTTTTKKRKKRKSKQKNWVIFSFRIVTGIGYWIIAIIRSHTAICFSLLTHISTYSFFPNRTKCSFSLN